MTAKWGVVIVSAGVSEWNEMTVPAYRSLGINTRTDYDLVLVDNGGSSRGQVNFNKMVCYAEAANAGAKLIKNEKLIILNNDITVNADLFARLENYNGVPYGGAVSLVKEGVEYIEGWCIVIDKDVWDFLGGFHEEYKNSWEDVDLAWRLRRIGIHPKALPVPIYHIWGATRRRYPGSNQWDEENRQRLLSRIREREAIGG
jgi:GT2 family glycosyltransferase